MSLPNGRIKITRHRRDICVLAMRRHIALCVAMRNPVEDGGENLLPLRVALHVRAPLLLHRVERVAVDCLQCGNEWSAVNGVVHLLVVERHTGDVDDLKPLFYFFLRALADIEREFCFREELLKFRVQGIELLLTAVILHRQFVGKKAAE